MSSLRPESHVAQQIRREKLRIQNSSQFPNNDEHLSLHPVINNLDLLQVRNVRNANNMLDELGVYSSFSTSSTPLEYHQEQYGSFPHSMSMSAIHSSHKEQCEIRNLGHWRNSSNPHQGGSECFVNYASNDNSFVSANYNEPMDCEIVNNDDPPPPSSPLYHNALQDIVKSANASFGSHTMMQQNDASEVELQQPIYRNHPNQTVGNITSGYTHQSLSLSLSSNAQGSASSEDPQCSKHVMKSIVKPSIVSGDSLREYYTVGVMPSTSSSIISYRSVGPLGPFTGYATILKSSKFLESAQQLLDEIFCLSGAKFGKSYEDDDALERVSSELSHSTSVDAVTGVAAKGGSDSASSSFMLYLSNKNRADLGVIGSSFGLSSHPDYQHKKAKLLFMQEEVTRQCKQYYIQMQMVVSSFESVAGLGSATPYIPMVLKSVSKHFRCLKNSISDQLKLISEQALGEDLVSVSILPSTSNMAARIRCNAAMDQSFMRNQSCRGTMELIESSQQHQHNHHVWRPQRGLPEPAVAILKAWLFEHFLHPYPTDSDKHMLASQTGLSRNQVSNWFINARVRVWKPMVEEIHMLETKAKGSKDNCGKNEGSSSGTGVNNINKALISNINGMHSNSIHETQIQSMDINEESGLNSQEWSSSSSSQEKRSKLEYCQMASNMDNGTVMGFVPYQHGSVSLTLGLRHGVEGVQQQQLQEEQLKHNHHLGGHMIHDFVG